MSALPPKRTSIAGFHSTLTLGIPRDDVGIVLHMRNQKFVFAHATTEKIMVALAGDFFEG